MAEGFIKKMCPDWQVYSAGTIPSGRVHPKAVQVMKEAGIDISSGYSKSVDQFLDKSFDYVITVCDNARETCPIFLGNVKEQRHIGFEDPAEANGTEKEILAVFRRVRDEIKRDFADFVNEISKQFV